MYLDGKYIIGKRDGNQTEYDNLLFARWDLECAIIPSNVKIIGANSFEQSKIKNISIQSQVTEIHSCAFSRCQNLYKIDFECNISQ